MPAQVSDVFEDSVFTSEVDRRSVAMAKLPPRSLQYTKALMRTDADREHLRRVNKAECERLVERWTSQECADAIMAFMASRTSGNA